jgi:hypothetical protein
MQVGKPRSRKLKLKAQKFESILRAASAAVLLIVPIYFGYVGKPTEMGLVIAAGFIGLVFSSLDKFESFKAGGIEAKLKLEQIDAIIDKQTESDYSEGLESPGIEIPNLDLVPKNAQDVLAALHDPNYTWRYVSGVCKATKLNRGSVQAALEWLVAHGYVKKSIGKNGEIWALTSEGRSLYVRVRFKNVQGGVPA